MQAQSLMLCEEIYELMYDGKQRSNAQIAKALGRKPHETRPCINHMLRTKELKAIPTYQTTLYERT